MPYRQLAYLPDRRSTRIEQSVHITVRGLDASRSAYEEKVSTLSVNCHGCRYLSRNDVLRGDTATLEVVQPDNGRLKRSAPVRVMSVKRLGVETLFDVAVEFESPQNIWGIASPPEDWFEASTPAAAAVPTRELRIVPRPQALEASESKQEADEALWPPRSLGTGHTAPLPPLLVYLAESLREQLENQAANILDRMVTASMDELTRRAQKLSEAQESAARGIYEYWIQQFEQEMANAGRLLCSSSETIDSLRPVAPSNTH